MFASAMHVLSSQNANLLVVGVLLAAFLVLRDASRATR